MPSPQAGADLWDDIVNLLLDGEDYTFTTFQEGEILKLLNRDRYLRNRHDKLVNFFWATDDTDPAVLTAPAVFAATLNTTPGTSFVDNSTPGLTVSATNLVAGDRCEIEMTCRAHITAPATKGYMRIGRASGVVLVRGAHFTVTSTSVGAQDHVFMRGVYTVPADVAGQTFNPLIATDNAAGLIAFGGPKQIIVKVYRP